PNRVVFSWDIGPTWQVETNPELTSEVEVTFVAETPDRTRVELEHRHIDRHGPGWESLRDGVGHDQGWPLYLTRYAALFTEDH
ncbi:MAG: SRPBCC domain-containing protein, partial [Actinoplanes sp.]